MWFLLKTSKSPGWLQALKLLDTDKYKDEIGYTVFKDNSAITIHMIPDIIDFVRLEVTRETFSKQRLLRFLAEQVAKKTIRWYLYHPRPLAALAAHESWGMSSFASALCMYGAS